MRGDGGFGRSPWYALFYTETPDQKERSGGTMNQFLKHEGVRKYPSISKLPTGGMYQTVKGDDTVERFL